MPAYQLDVNKDFISSLFRNKAESLKELIKDVGISHQTFLNIERTGQSSRNTLKRISEYFEVPYDQLLMGGSLQYDKPAPRPEHTNEPEPEQYHNNEVTLVKDLLNTYLQKIDQQLTDYKGKVEGRDKIISDLKSKVAILEAELKRLKSS